MRTQMRLDRMEELAVGIIFDGPARDINDAGVRDYIRAGPPAIQEVLCCLRRRQALTL